MDYFFLFLTVLCIAVQFSINRSYQKRFVRGFSDILLFPAMCGAVNVVLFTLLSLCLTGGLPEFSAFSFLMSLALAAVSILSSAVGMLVMKYGSMSVYSMFMMLGGMMLPYGYGVLFLDESLSAARIAGLVLLVCALPCSVGKPAGECGQGKGTGSPKFYYALCVLIFLLNGTVSIISKAHAVNSAAVQPVSFTFYFNLWQMLISGAVYLWGSRFRKAGGREARPEGKGGRAFMTAAAFALVSGVGFLFQMTAAQTVPAVVLFPFITGGTIIFSAITARIAFGERIGARALAGMALSLAGTLLFLIP